MHANGSSDAKNAMLSTLGRRMERLLFSGVLIIGACFVHVFFALASERFSMETPAQGLERLITEIETEEARLNELYRNRSPSPAPAVTFRPNTSRERLIAETRKNLGLPPEKVEPPPKTTSPRIETYQDRLRDLINKAAIASRANPDALAKSVDVTKAPKDNLVSLREILAAEARKPVQVWGIEMPRLLQVQYGGMEYKIPATFIATATQFALGPLVLAWLCSIYATRQRELVLVNSLDDFKHLFPHVLNYFPVIFYDIADRQGNRKLLDNKFLRAGNRFLIGVFRCFVHVLTIVPMVGGFVFAVIKLRMIGARLSAYDDYIMYPLIILMCVTTLAIVVQEIVIPAPKEFINE